jgi:hypothetical protein
MKEGGFSGDFGPEVESLGWAGRCWTALERKSPNSVGWNGEDEGPGEDLTVVTENQCRGCVSEVLDVTRDCHYQCVPRVLTHDEDLHQKLEKTVNDRRGDDRIAGETDKKRENTTTICM